MGKEKAVCEFCKYHTTDTWENKITRYKAPHGGFMDNYYLSNNMVAEYVQLCCTDSCHTMIINYCPMCGKKLHKSLA